MSDARRAAFPTSRDQPGSPHRGVGSDRADGGAVFATPNAPRADRVPTGSLHPVCVTSTLSSRQSANSSGDVHSNADTGYTLHGTGLLYPGSDCGGRVLALSSTRDEIRSGDGLNRRCPARRTDSLRVLRTYPSPRRNPLGSRSDPRYPCHELRLSRSTCSRPAPSLSLHP